MNQLTKHIAAALLLSGFSIANVLADDGRPCHGPGFKGHHHGVERMLHKLDLSSEQKTALEDVLGSRAERREQMKQRRAEKRSFRQEVMAAVRDGASRDEVRSLLNQQTEQRLDALMQRGETYREVRDILTEEQRAELDALLQKRLEKTHG